MPALGMPVYVPADDRYDSMPYRRCGRSGVLLPAISLGLWQNFGDDRPLDTSRAILRRAFDRGITHFDLANNYGPPYGSAEVNFGRMMREDFAPFRDELVISTKAGWDMWPGPYGGGRPDPAGAGHPAADPPAVVLDAEPLDRARPARRPRPGGRGLHRL